MGGAHVFVSYASPDAPLADELVHSLEALGLRIWYAPRDLIERLPRPRDWGEASLSMAPV